MWRRFPSSNSALRGPAWRIRGASTDSSVPYRRIESEIWFGISVGTSFPSSEVRAESAEARTVAAHGRQHRRWLDRAPVAATVHEADWCAPTLPFFRSDIH